MLGFDRFKVTLVTAICLLGVLFAAPNLFKKETLETLPDFIPANQVNLGLDLKGGSYLLLEVDFDAVEKEQLTSYLDTLRTEFRKAKIGLEKAEIQNGNLTIILEDSNQSTQANNIALDIDRMMNVDTKQQGIIGVSLKPEQFAQRRTMILNQSVEIVRRRLDETGTKEPAIQAQGEKYIQVQLPGVENPASIKKILGKTAKMTFHLVDDRTSFEDASRGRISPSSMILPSENGGKEVVKKRIMLGGERLIDARPEISDEKGWMVSFKFDTAGGKKFGEITRKNVNKRFAIVLDGRVISAPVIKGPILGGSGVIEGNFTAQGAQDLSVLMRAGALPAPLHITEERTVGPDLGSDSINAGMMACALGFALVVVFMVVYYGKFGLVANIGLIFNLILLIAVMSILGATLTLPGIAGIVLTMGMSVDANVLINERIDEELRNGKSPVAAIEEGYKRALASIIDAHMTTVLAGVVLYYFGTGPVKGFAVSLIIGLATSLFTAVIITRMIIAGWWAQFKPKKLKIHVLRFIPVKTNINFLKSRAVMLPLAGLLAAGFIGTFTFKGLNYGIDFKGGIVMEVKSNENIDLASMRSKINDLNLGDTALQEFGSPKDVLIRLDKQEGGKAEQMQAVEKIKTTLGDTYDYRRTEFVGPKVGEELTEKALWAIVLSLGFIMLYVWIRFEWQFGLCAVIALTFDVLATYGFISLTGLEYNLTMVASILTILGYCINDTVIIFDRIRENLKKDQKTPLFELLNQSVNETLARTIMTVVTVLLVLVALVAFGGPVLHGFSVVMIWGVVFGTLSSIFVGVSPLLWLNVRRIFDKDEEEGFRPSTKEN